MKKAILSLILLVGIISIAATIDVDNLFSYSELAPPIYVNSDNTPIDNSISDAGATLGRVLFYDKQLSLDGTISCSSCHHQEFAFGDTATQSVGMNGLTGRHSMRLVNARYSDEPRFFWDERAETLEDQVTMPIQDHVEMGFSGTDGDPGIDSLITRIAEIDYYQVLFPLAFNTPEVTEDLISKALAQFVRSIQSFDSPFDEGMNQTNNPNAPFPNFTQLENQGKNLYLTPQPEGGAGCAGCHGPAEFSIGPLTQNNGVIGTAGNADIDLTNTRAPSLRELVNPGGIENGPFMHDGSLATLMEVVNHYSAIPLNPQNTNLDPRLQGPPLNFNDTQKEALVAFLNTLSGSAVYTAEQWSNPFDENGDLDLIGGTTNVSDLNQNKYQVNVYPNPFQDFLTIDSDLEQFQLSMFSINGSLVRQFQATTGERVDLRDLPKGVYLVQLKLDDSQIQTLKVVKR